MQFNERKIVTIILDECKIIEERCEGYREELVEVVSDIITAERQHRVQGTNIQKNINDMCNTAGRFLAEQRGQVNRSDGDDG